MFHTIIVVGNLGKEPEMRYTPSGQAVTNFSIASSRQYSNGGGQSVKETIWFRISVWGKQAESCNQYLHKGSRVLVEGRLSPDPETGSPRIWESNGKRGASYEITANTVRFLTSGSKEGEDEPVTPGAASQNDPGSIEEIPF